MNYNIANMFPTPVLKFDFSTHKDNARLLELIKSWAIVECEKMNIDVEQCHQEVTIFVLPKSISKAKLESYALDLKKKHPTFVFLPDHKKANTKLKNISTGNGKHNLILVQRRKKLDVARNNLAKGKYYDNMSDDYKKKLFSY